MKTITTVLLLFLAGSCFAQQTIVPPPIQGNTFSFKDLLGITVVNPQSELANCVVGITITGAKKGLVIKGKSRQFNVATGANIFLGRENDFLPFNFDVLDNGFSSIIQSNRSLPADEYHVSYLLYTTSGGIETILASADDKLLSFTLPSIFLFQVPDKDTIEEKNPVFSWSGLPIPEAGGDGRSQFDFTYQIEFTEVWEGQSGEYSMMYNPKYHQEKDIKGNSYLYPFNARLFSDSGTYAWQIKAVKDGQEISRSEIWTFTYKIKKKIIPVLPVVMMSKGDAMHWTGAQRNRIKFGYRSDYGSAEPQKVRGQILDEKGKIIINSDRLQLEAVKGFNIYEFSLCPDGLDLKDGNYYIRLAGIKGDIWNLKFKYKRENGCE